MPSKWSIGLSMSMVQENKLCIYVLYGSKIKVYQTKKEAKAKPKQQRKKVYHFTGAID